MGRSFAARAISISDPIVAIRFSPMFPGSRPDMLDLSVTAKALAGKRVAPVQNRSQYSRWQCCRRFERRRQVCIRMDGKALAATVVEQVKDGAAEFERTTGTRPGLAVVIV